MTTEVEGAITSVTVTGSNDTYIESGTGHRVLELTNDQTKTFEVVCKDGNGNVVSDYNGSSLKVTNYHTDVFTASISGNVVSIAAVATTEAQGWVNVYLDQDNDDTMDDGEPKLDVHIYVNTQGAGAETASVSYVKIDGLQVTTPGTAIDYSVGVGQSITISMGLFDSNGQALSGGLDDNKVEVSNWTSYYSAATSQSGTTFTITITGNSTGEEWTQI